MSVILCHLRPTTRVRIVVLICEEAFKLKNRITKKQRSLEVVPFLSGTHFDGKDDVGSVFHHIMLHHLHPWKITWNLKKNSFQNGNLLFQSSRFMFRGYQNRLRSTRTSSFFIRHLRFAPPFHFTVHKHVQTASGSLVAETYWQRRLFWRVAGWVSSEIKTVKLLGQKFQYFFFSQIVISHLDMSAFDVTVSFLEDVKGEQNLQLWMKNAMVNPEGGFVSCDLGMQENRHCLKQRARDTPKWYIADGSIVSPSKWHDMTVPKGPALGHNNPCLGGQWRRNWYDNCAEKSSLGLAVLACLRGQRD